MANVIFSHPKTSAAFGDLMLGVNPDEITWAYGLNTANFPTYGGEVVQILSMFFDDMTISGTVSSYKWLERIYAWFIHYMQTATQGVKGTGSFNTTPVTFQYPTRGWEFKIWPKALPGFRYGTEVVAPTWTLQAAVAEPDAELETLIMDQAVFNAQHSGEFDGFGKATAAIGYREQNPWSDPAGDPQFKEDTASARNMTEADFFNKLIPSYLDGNFSDLQAVSKPPDLTPTDGKQTKTASTGKHRNRGGFGTK